MPAARGEIFLPKKGNPWDRPPVWVTVKSPQGLRAARHRVNALVAGLRTIPRHRYIAGLGVLLALAILRSALGARAPATWLLENALVAIGLLLLALAYRRMPLSRVSYTLIFLFTCLHEVGAHWTYAHVPYDAWWQSLFGTTLNAQLGFERNHFDRVVHFSYGLLLAYPLREIFLRLANVRGFWGYFLPLDFTMSTSMIYELLEWPPPRSSAATPATISSVRRAMSGMRTRTWPWPRSAR